MKDDSKTIAIDPDALVARLHEIEAVADGDITRVIELLLVENHVLKSQQSAGLMRGSKVHYDSYPRFLKPEDASNEGIADGSEVAGEPSDS